MSNTFKLERKRTMRTMTMVLFAALMLGGAPNPDQAFVNSVLADPGWRLFGTIYPQDADDILIALTADSPLSQCAEMAVLVCGAGSTCWLCVTDQSCSFGCRDADGGCQPAPPCGSDTPDIGGTG